MERARISGLAAAWLGCGATACIDTYGVVGEAEPDEALPDIARFRPHVQMGVADDMQICGWSLDYAERFVELYLAASANGEPAKPIEYHVIDAATVDEACGRNVSACARRGVVYSESPIHTHELVHAIRQLQRGDGGMSFFEEGIAQLHYPVAIGTAEGFSPLELPELVGKPMKASLYDPAAQLLGVVEEWSSFAVVEELVDASAAIEAPDDLEAVVADTLGIDLDELARRYAAHHRCSAAGRARLLVECATPPEPWVDVAWADAPYVVTEVEGLVCADPRVTGPLEDRLWVFYTIEIPTQGSYRLRVEHDEGQRMHLTSCDDPCGVDVRWDEGPFEVDLALAPGRYAFRLSRELGDDRSVGLFLRGPVP